MLSKKGAEKKTCQICGNKDENYFTYINDDVYYCRKCINFKKEKLANKNYCISEGHSYYLDYNLTKKQQQASDFILNNMTLNKDVAINAVCGAGKSEIIYSVIKQSLFNKETVGIAIPRKDVVLELVDRLSKDFKDNSVIGVYGGNTSQIEADIIIFTTHQAYRYIGYFKTLIIDEVDAFPYKGNEVLKSMLDKCCIGNRVYLSATMPSYIEKDKNIAKFYLNRRFHDFDLPVPKIKLSLFMNYRLIEFLKRHHNKRILVFFPTISLLEKISKKTREKHLVVHSKIKNRNQVLSTIKKMDKGIIFTTSVLERGVTLKGVQVVVYQSDHDIFDKDMLIQIAGRVGRKSEEPYGEVMFLAQKTTLAMKECIKTISKYNHV